MRHGFRFGPTFHKQQITRLLTETENYVSRVEGDGGLVPDTEYVDAHISKLKSLGWWGDLTMLVDPASGWKDDGSGQVQKLYDLSANNFDPMQATFTSRPRHLSNGWGSLPAASYDGVADFLSHPDDDKLDIYESTTWFIIWFNVDNNGANGNQAFSKSAPSISEQEFNMRVRESISEVDFNVSSGGSSSSDAGVVIPGPNQWVMFYGAYDDTGGAETIYASVNDGAVNIDTLPNSPNRFTQPLEIGALTDQSEYFEGDLGLFLYGKKPNVSDSLPHEDGTLTDYYTFTQNQAGL